MILLCYLYCCYCVHVIKQSIDARLLFSIVLDEISWATLMTLKVLNDIKSRKTWPDKLSVIF